MCNRLKYDQALPASGVRPGLAWCRTVCKKVHLQCLGALCYIRADLPGLAIYA